MMPTQSDDARSPVPVTPRGPGSHEQTLRAWLDQLRQRWRLLTGLGVAARVVGLLAAVVLLAWLADRLLHPAGPALVALYAVAAIIGTAGTLVLLRPLRRVPTNRQLARLAEERDETLDEVVVTATERLEAAQAGPFDGLVVRSAAQRLQALEPDRVIERGTMSRAWRWAVVAAVVFVASAGVGWGPAWRAFQTARLYIAPPTMEVRVHPGHARVARGSALQITAELHGLPSGATPVAPLLHVTQQGGGTTRVPMRAEGGRFVADWPSVDRSLRYRVESGSLTSPEFGVAALDAARVTRIDLEYEFPAFTKLTPRTEQDAGDIFGPAGTHVRVRVHTDKPVTRGALALRDGGPVALQQEGTDTALVATLTLQQDSAYRVGLTDVDGLASPEGTEYFIRILDDRPPDVRIMRPGGDRQVTRLEEIVLEAQADDDHGISALELVYAVKGAREKVVPLHRAPRDAQRGSTSVTGAHTLFVEELDVSPGDFITYYARARDVSRGKRSTEARSDIFFLEVRPFTEEFFAAQSQSMMAGGGGQAADLLEAQKEIIVATWKLQRRAIAGQSASDVRAVGKAQAQVRQQAEQMAAQMTRATAPRRRREATPQPPSPAADENPLLRATAAMARAESALNGLKPAEAVPHEMTAYNELLKLQAENTRRQVARQRGGGGGGGRTGTQDLSALFDEELLRQQETNYENRNAGSSGSQDQAKDDTLEKLKALARRQDEIAQRQRELARARAALPREEVKRQLERLTREQEELRRQAEALSQQMARQQREQQPGSQSQGQQASGQAGQSGQSQAGQSQGRGSQSQQGPGSEGSETLREAAEQMAGAARELSQENLDEAQRQAEQTRDRLLDLERRMSGEAVPDEGRRAFGELQLESQQVAESQRRLANESQRLQGGARPGPSATAGRGTRDEASREGASSEASAATRDALRRLAAEQERLAQRTEALDKRLQGVTRQRGGEEAAKAAAAAREAIARARLAEEMRRTAEALRQAGAPAATGEPRAAGRGTQAPTREASTASAAERADALARAAATVADRLGAPVGDSPEARQLSEQLAQLRGLRERMSDIESRLRDAVQRNGGQPARAGSQAGQRGTPGNQQGNPQANPQAGQSGGQQEGGGQQGSSAQQAGNQGGRQGGSQGEGQGGGRDGGAGEVQRLQAEYDAALRQTRQLLDGMSRQGGNGVQTGAMATPEGHEFSRSAPGTEAFKQDYAKWESLTRNVNNALETMEASLAQRLSERAARDRVNAGGDDRVPAQYSDSVSRYYRSLARKPQ